MDVRAYLDRIGFEGQPAPDRATLDAIHSRHLLAIPYENLDVQLGSALTTSPQAAFDKLVNRRRGGWCYEMNGTLGLALEVIGFRVTRMAGGVMRSASGDAAVGNHLVLKVDLPEGPVIADAGFGDGSLLPFDLKEGPFRANGFDFDLERLPDGWWRLNNHPRGGAPNFDFRTELAEEALLSERCQFLQTSEASPFVQNLVVQIHRPGGLTLLRGRVLKTIDGEAESETLLDSASALTDALGDVFGLDAPEAAGLWEKVVRRHDALFAGS